MLTVYAGFDGLSIKPRVSALIAVSRSRPRSRYRLPGECDQHGAGLSDTPCQQRGGECAQETPSTNALCKDHLAHGKQTSQRLFFRDVTMGRAFDTIDAVYGLVKQDHLHPAKCSSTRAAQESPRPSSRCSNGRDLGIQAAVACLSEHWRGTSRKVCALW